MNAHDLLTLAHGYGVEVHANGEKLKVQFDENSPPPPNLIDLLRNHKADLLAYLAGQRLPMPPSNQHTGATPLTSDQSRALNGFHALLERRRQTLIRGGYPPSEALVSVDAWYKAIMTRLQIGRDAMRDIERSLVLAGLIKIDRNRNHVEPSDGVPLTCEQAVQQDDDGLVWGGGSGADFVRWLYS